MSGSNSTNIKLFCHVQSSLATQVTSSQNNIRVSSSNNYNCPSWFITKTLPGSSYRTEWEHVQSLQNILPRLSSKQFSKCKTLGKVSLVSSSDFVFSIKFTNKNNLRSGSGPLNPSGYVKEYIGKTVFIGGKSLRKLFQIVFCCQCSPPWPCSPLKFSKLWGDWRWKLCATLGWNTFTRRNSSLGNYCWLHCLCRVA